MDALICSQCVLLFVRMVGTLVWEQRLCAKPSAITNLYSIEEHSALGITQSYVQIMPPPPPREEHCEERICKTCFWPLAYRTLNSGSLTLILEDIGR